MTAKKSNTAQKSATKNGQAVKTAAKKIRVHPSAASGSKREVPVHEKPAPARKSGSAGTIPDLAGRIIDETSALIKDEISGAGVLNPLDRRDETAKSKSPAGIVAEAASILSEEITRGFDTAKKIGDNLGDATDKGRHDNTEVIQQFRSQAHSAVDVMINLVSLMANPVNGLTGQYLTGSTDTPGTGSTGGSAGSDNIPSLAISKATRPGGQVKFQMTLENEGDSQTERSGLISTDLQSSTGERISSDNVTFRPESVTLEPRESLKVDVIIDIPGDTPPGKYSGLIQATRLEMMRAVISVIVE